MKKIITIARQCGSGGHEIGVRLAEKLNIPLHDKDLVDKAIKDLNLDQDEAEKDENIFADCLNKFVMGYHNLFGMDRPYYIAEYSTVNDQMYKAQREIIKGLAEQGPCVIVGRCADYILRKRDDVLSVFICADEKDRIERIERVREVNHERAVHIVETTDKGRASHYKVYTEREWEDANNYDLVLNVSRLGADAVVEILAKLYEG